MQRRVRVVFMAGALLFALVATGCGGDRGATTVRTADGAASLTFDAGALPKGVHARDITIKPIAAADLAPSIKGATPLVGFQIEPDGLELTAPVTVSVTVPITQLVGAGPVTLVHLSNRPADFFIDGLEAEGNANDRTVTFRGKITHFSRVTLTGADASTGLSYFTTTVAPSSPRVRVGETFTTTFSVTRASHPLRIEPSSGMRGFIADIAPGSWTLSGGAFLFGPLKPDYMPDLPSQTEITEANFSTTRSVECTAAGAGAIAWGTTISFTTRHVGFDGKPLYANEYKYRTVWWTAADVDCISGSGGGSGVASPFVEITVLTIGGRNYPAVQFRAAEPDACGKRHWHARSGPVHTTTTGFEPLPDPNPSGCGYGTLDDLKPHTIEVNRLLVEEWEKAHGPIR